MNLFWTAIFAALFSFFGAALEGGEGFVVGLMFGALVGLYFALKSKVHLLERRLDDADKRLNRLLAANEAPRVNTTSNASQADKVEYNELTASATLEPLDDGESPQQFGPLEPSADAHLEQPADPWLEAPPGLPQGPARTPMFEHVFSTIKRFFTSGNVVVKVGLVVLFFGVSFLIKYAQERHLLPIELRLSAIALFSIGLLVTGWKLRNRRRAYAMVLQGGAIGILLLTVFGVLHTSIT